MKRLEVFYRPDALDDLRAIHRWVYEKSRNPVTATVFLERLFEACEKIGGMPLGGVARDDLMPGLRTFPFERRAVIAYFVTADTVHISNVFYGGRDYDALFDGTSDPRS